MPRNRLGWLMAVSLPVAFVFSYWTPITQILDIWNSGDNSYCAVIPFVCGYLFWHDRAKLQMVKAGPSWLLGVLIVLAALILHLLGVQGALGYPIRLSAYLMLVGLLALNLGWSFIRAFIFPILLLFFAIPFPKYLLTRLTFKLQLLSTKIAALFLSTFHYVVYVEGNCIDLGFTKLQVVEACSGLRYTLPLLLLAGIYGYLCQRVLWKRITLIIASIPISILVNGMRIAGIGMLTGKIDINLSEGFAHFTAGLIVFVISTALIAGLDRLLNSIFPVPAVASHPIDPGKLETKSLLQFFRPKAYLVSICFLLVSVGTISQFTGRSGVIPGRRSLYTLPTRIGQWVGSLRALDPRTMAVTGASEAITGDYARGGTRIEMLITYYYRQAPGGDAVHSPGGCLLGSGWNFVSNKVVKIEGISQQSDFRANQVVIQKGSQYMLVNYWYQERGRIMTDDLAERYFLVRDSLVQGRSDGALVRLISPMSSVDDLRSTQQSMSGFILGLEKILPLYIPD